MAETTRQAGAGYGSGAETTSGSSGVQDKAQQVAGQAQEKAQQAAGQAQSRIKSVVDERSTQAGEQVSQQANDLRSVSEQLRSQGKEGPAKVADQVAQRTERVGNYLQQADGDTILEDIEDFARRAPWAVTFGGIALGFLAARFLKASSSERYEARSSGVYGRPLPQPRSRYRSGYYARTGTEYGLPSGSPDPSRRAGLAGAPIAPTPGTSPAAPVGSP